MSSQTCVAPQAAAANEQEMANAVPDSRSDSAEPVATQELNANTLTISANRSERLQIGIGTSVRAVEAAAAALGDAAAGEWTRRTSTLPRAYHQALSRGRSSVTLPAMNGMIGSAEWLWS
jgi:hypothetical protein